MSKGKPIEFWRSMRSLVERGLSLKRAAKQFGMSYSAVQARSALEGWKFHGRGRPKILDHPDGTERAQTAKREAERDAAEAMLEHEAEVLVIDAKKAELSCQKVLATHSVRLKVAFSELVVQTVEDLALGALRSVCDRLYGWDKEPDLHELKVAQTAAINLELQATSPQKLKQMALAKAGLLAPEHDGQGVGPITNSPEQPQVGTGGQAGEKKEAPKQSQKDSQPSGPAGHPSRSEKRDPEWDSILAPQTISGQLSQCPQNKDGQEGVVLSPEQRREYWLTREQARRESQLRAREQPR